MIKKDIIFFGIQGSGKGTQAKLLLESYPEFKYLEPGNVFRAICSNDNIISSYIISRMQRGEMLDDSLILDLFNMYYHLLQEKELILVDGFPRTIAQMYYFLSKEYKHKREYIAVLFDIPRKLVVERIIERAKFENRQDDLDLHTINTRLDLFEKETLPVIEQFRNMGKLITIDANQSIEVIHTELLSKLELA